MQHIDIWLSDAKQHSDFVPRDADLRTARMHLAKLEALTREDHLRSVDELLSQVPSEFQTKVKTLSDAETFVRVAAAGEAHKITKLLDGDADLITAIDVSRDLVK